MLVVEAAENKFLSQLVKVDVKFSFCCVSCGNDYGLKGFVVELASEDVYCFCVGFYCPDFLPELGASDKAVFRSFAYDYYVGLDAVDAEDSCKC